MPFRYATIPLAGLMIASSAIAQPSGDIWAEAVPLAIKLSSFKYDPSTITLRHGVPYILRLENVSDGGHDFQAREFFAQAEIAETDRPKVSDGKVSLRGGESADIHLIAPKPGNYKIRCTHFLHSSFGMTGQLLVQ